jgi:hypothetical protein
MHFAVFVLSKAGVAQLARASAFQAEGRGFESRFPLVDIVGFGVAVILRFMVCSRSSVGRARPW